MKLSVISPVKNEAQFIGYSIMAILPYVHEIIYACAKSTDGTDELLDYIKDRYAKDRLILLRKVEYDFNVHDMPSYNKSFNDCIATATGDACWFLHPDMIVTNPEKIPDIPKGLAWYTHMDSFAKDLNTKIVQGRANKWKNIQAKKLGLHYYGGYGSQNEDFYFRDITGNKYIHYGTTFEAYPYRVLDSGIKVNHYCELKDFSRRYDKMKKCLKTIYPGIEEKALTELALAHPRVTLEQSSEVFGRFEFLETNDPVPEVFGKYKDEFEAVTSKCLGEKA